MLWIRGLKNGVLGLGSPKLDKLANTRREELKTPEDWLKIVQKSDGIMEIAVVWCSWMDKQGKLS